MTPPAQGFAGAVQRHVLSLTRDFSATTVPWKRRSVVAGCSGILFVLPGLFAFDEARPETVRRVAASTRQCLAPRQGVTLAAAAAPVALVQGARPHAMDVPRWSATPP